MKKILKMMSLAVIMVLLVGCQSVNEGIVVNPIPIPQKDLRYLSFTGTNNLVNFEVGYELKKPGIIQYDVTQYRDGKKSIPLSSHGVEKEPGAILDVMAMVSPDKDGDINLMIDEDSLKYSSKTSAFKDFREGVSANTWKIDKQTKLEKGKPVVVMAYRMAKDDNSLSFGETYNYKDLSKEKNIIAVTVTYKDVKK